MWGVADAGQTSDATTPTPYPLTYPHLGRPPSYPPYPPSYPLPPPGQSLDSQGIINRLIMVSQYIELQEKHHVHSSKAPIAR